MHARFGGRRRSILFGGAPRLPYRRPRSGLRGAGRGEAAPGGIAPGDRSEGPGGRPYLSAGQAGDIESPTIRHGSRQRARRGEESSSKAPEDRLLAAFDAMSEGGRPGWVARSGTLGTLQKRPTRGDAGIGPWCGVGKVGCSRRPRGRWKAGDHGARSPAPKTMSGRLDQTAERSSPSAR